MTAFYTDLSSHLKTIRFYNKTSSIFRNGPVPRVGYEIQCQKCYLLSTNPPPPRSSHFYTIDNHIFKQVQDSQYLGIIISEDLKLGTNINTISKKANSKLGFLRRYLHHCPLSCRKNAYMALVRSKLEYGSVV